MDRRSIALVPLYDLSKAFDSVSHSVLSSTCAQLNLDSFWLADYVNNITQSVCQSVCIYNTVSLTLKIAYEVPQGWIRDPVFFNVNLTDVAYKIAGCIVAKHAANTQFLHTSTINNSSVSLYKR